MQSPWTLGIPLWAEAKGLFVLSAQGGEELTPEHTLTKSLIAPLSSAVIFSVDGWKKQYADIPAGKISLSELWITLIRQSQINQKITMRNTRCGQHLSKMVTPHCMDKKITNINECSLTTGDYDIHNLPSEDSEKHGCYSTFLHIHLHQTQTLHHYPISDTPRENYIW